jgi:hypothetical protein
VRRVENGLLAPHRVGRTETKPHDGTIITDKVNEMWGTDLRLTGEPSDKLDVTPAAYPAGVLRDEADSFKIRIAPASSELMRRREFFTSLLKRRTGLDGINQPSGGKSCK